MGHAAEYEGAEDRRGKAWLLFATANPSSGGSVIRLGTERSETTRPRTTQNIIHASSVTLVALLLPFIFGAIPINYSARSLPLSNIQLVSFT